jgi:hypothetical protein
VGGGFFKEEVQLVSIKLMPTASIPIAAKRMRFRDIIGG